MASDLTYVLTLPRIRELADERSFQRGQKYFERERVGSLVLRGSALTATVTGTDAYSVRLAVENKSLRFSCTCPVGGDGIFCKHCVAAGLAWLDAGADPARTDKASLGASSPLVQLDDLRPWLLAQPVPALAEHLLEVAERDHRLRETLLRAAARSTGRRIDLAAYRDAFDRATRTDGFIDYYSAGNYARSFSEAMEPIRDLLSDAPEHAPDVIELVEHALRRAEAAMENADDSNGAIGSLLHELQELHWEACRIAKPDPVPLACRLFKWEMADPWDLFAGAVETYGDLLGKSGRAKYRELAEAAWKKLPAAPKDERDAVDLNRLQLTRMMECFAREEHDIDALIAIKSKNLSASYYYLEIAQLCRSAKRPEAALDWAERGRKAFPSDWHSPLVDFVADEYQRRRRRAEAVALVWQKFDALPSLDSYRLLEQHAKKAGCWPATRQRALDWLRERASAQPRDSRRFTLWPDLNRADRSLLVEILLWEKKPDDAWTEAQAGGCSRPLWLKLAHTREKRDAAAAITIYLREAEQLIAATNKQAYEAAARHLWRVRQLHLEANRLEEWQSLIARLRQAHKAKRNFIALTDGL